MSFELQTTPRAEIPFVIRYRGSDTTLKGSVLGAQGTSFEVPGRRRKDEVDFELSLSRPGSYRFQVGQQGFDFEVLPRPNVGMLGELGLTVFLVLIGMGGAIRWARRKKERSAAAST